MSDMSSSVPTPDSDTTVPSTSSPPGDQQSQATASQATASQATTSQTTASQTTASPDLRTSLLKRAQSSLRQTIKRYTEQSASTSRISDQTDFQMQLKQLASDLNKLEHRVFRIAVFGLVSRGKSSVINALIQQDVLKTGPLHGVTKWPRSVYWEPKENASQLRVELIDTPGLDEVEGVDRAAMAQEVAQEADLILFVLAGDLTQMEYNGLAQLRRQQKPVVLVCNKMDQYPDHDQGLLLRQLDELERSISKTDPSSNSNNPDKSGNCSNADNASTGDSEVGAGSASSPTPVSRAEQSSNETSSLPWILTANDVVQIAAAPAPIQVRVEWPDGRISHEWETPEPQIAALEQHLHQILEQDGMLLIALSALRESQSAEATIATTAMETYAEQAEELLWQFAKWKGLAIAINPIAVLDVAGGIAVDLVLIRSLARLYGLPMTGYDAGKLWNAIIWSAGGLAVGEVGSGLFSGLGKSMTLLTGGLGSAVWYPTSAIAQAVLAGYGAYRVGKAAQVYLQKGCTWGPRGPSTVIETLFNQMDDSTVISRLRDQLIPKP